MRVPVSLESGDARKRNILEDWHIFILDAWIHRCQHVLAGDKVQNSNQIRLQMERWAANVVADPERRRNKV